MAIIPARLGLHTQRLHSTSATQKKLGIGLCGFGVVGSSVAKLLSPQSRSTLALRLPNVELQITSIARRRLYLSGEEKNLLSKDVALTIDPVAVARNPSTKIFVEVMGGIHPAYKAISTALQSRTPVVTGNKYLLAKRPELFHLATEMRTPLLFEAAVAGGIPVIETLRTHLAGAKISSISGVLNGSTNYILERLNEGTTIGTAMNNARVLGYLEANPKDDVEGKDAYYKAAILHRLAFPGVHFESSVEGITKLEKPPQGKKWRLLCTISRGKVAVIPQLVGGTSPFWTLPDATNAVLIESNVGRYWMTGPGAGGMPTAGSVVGDVVKAADFVLGREG